MFTYSSSVICLLYVVLSITKLSLLCSLTVHLLFACYLLCCLLQNYHCCVHLQSICYLPAICSAVYYKIIIAVITYSPSVICLLSVVLSITKLSLLCSLTVHLLFACYLLCCLLQDYHCCVHLQFICYLPAICSAVYYKIDKCLPCHYLLCTWSVY